MPEEVMVSKKISWPKVIWTTLTIAVVAGLIGGGLFWYFYVRETTESTSTTVNKQASPSANKNDSSNVVRDEVWKALEQQQKVSVIISLYMPESPENKNDLETYKREIKIIQDRVLSLLAPEDFDLVYQYEAIPGLAGQITKKGLEAIKDSKDVISVGLNIAVKISLL